MPSPVGRDLYVDALLTNVSISYSNGIYIADGLAPLVPVQLQSGIVPKYDQSPWFRDAAKLRAPGTKSEGGGWSTDLTDKYFCSEYSFRHEITDQDRRLAASPFNLDSESAKFVTDKLQMRREVAFAADFFKTGVWGTDKTGATDFTKWSDYANSDPLVNLTDFMDTVEGLTAREPNRLVLGKQVWNKLKWHPDVIDTIKYTQTAIVGKDLFASLVGIEKVDIGRAIYTTSVEGTAEASVTYTRIWGKNALMLYTPSSPGLMNPAAMYTFVWQFVPNAIQYITRMRDQERRVDIIEGSSWFDQKVTAANAGLFMSSAVA